MSLPVVSKEVVRALALNQGSDLVSDFSGRLARVINVKPPTEEELINLLLATVKEGAHNPNLGLRGRSFEFARALLIALVALFIFSVLLLLIGQIPLFHFFGAVGVLVVSPLLVPTAWYLSSRNFISNAGVVAMLGVSFVWGVELIVIIPIIEISVDSLPITRVLIPILSFLPLVLFLVYFDQMLLARVEDEVGISSYVREHVIKILSLCMEIYPNHRAELNRTLGPRLGLLGGILTDTDRNRLLRYIYQKSE